MNMLHIEGYEIGPIATDCYFVTNRETTELVIIDPAIFPQSLYEKVKKEGLTPVAILLTHGHHDHIMGVPGWKEQFPEVPVIACAKEAEVLADPKKNLTFRFREYAISLVPDRLVEDGEAIRLLGRTFRVLHTPGHTEGSCCFYLEPQEEAAVEIGSEIIEDPVLFAGDTLFRMSMGRCDLPTGDEDAMMQSRSILSDLPEATRVFPGHGPSTRISWEKQSNPYMRR